MRKKMKIVLVVISIATSLNASVSNVATITDIKEAVAVLIELYAKTSAEVQALRGDTKSVDKLDNFAIARDSDIEKQYLQLKNQQTEIMQRLNNLEKYIQDATKLKSINTETSSENDRIIQIGRAHV